MFDVIIRKVKEHAEDILRSEKLNAYPYHSIEHTQEVAKSAVLIGKNEGLDDTDLAILEIAAWFHDIGYETDIENHENRSAEMATEFLQELLSEKDLQKVTSLINATKLEHQASNLMEEILQDADINHLGSKNFNVVSQNLRREWSNTQSKNYTDKEWLELNIDFFESKKYLTKTGCKLFDKIKAKNLAKMKKDLKKMDDSDGNSRPTKKELKAQKKKEKAKKSATIRGRETAYRISLRNHIHLSKIADNKANIMLSVNALILSYVLSTNINNTIEQAYLHIPTLAIIATSLLTILTATLATRPKVTQGKLSKADSINKKGNPLFFGNFHSMDIVDFEKVMTDLMKDEEYLYNSLTRDLYYLGKVLNTKYKYLNITYTIFVVGMIIASFAYIITVTINS